MTGCHPACEHDETVTVLTDSDGMLRLASQNVPDAMPPDHPIQLHTAFRFAKKLLERNVSQGVDSGNTSRPDTSRDVAEGGDAPSSF